MLFRRFFPLLACCAWLIGAAPQKKYDREAYAREYIQFLVLQLDQWPVEFPRQFDRALMQPPVDAAKLSDVAKASPSELGQSIKRLASLSASPGSGKNLMGNADFRGEVNKALGAAKQVNQAMVSQRFPSRLQSDWDQIRSVLNNLARVYKLETLAVLEAPAGGLEPLKLFAGGLVGYIVDQSCAKKGKGMWANPECVARCVRDGDKVVLVTDEGKLYEIANPDKIDSDTYGRKVTIIGKIEGEMITIDSLKI